MFANLNDSLSTDYDDYILSQVSIKSNSHDPCTTVSSLDDISSHDIYRTGHGVMHRQKKPRSEKKVSHDFQFTISETLTHYD